MSRFEKFLGYVLRGAKLLVDDSVGGLILLLAGFLVGVFVGVALS